MLSNGDIRIQIERPILADHGICFGYLEPWQIPSKHQIPTVHADLSD